MVLEKAQPSSWQKHLTPSPRLDWKPLGSATKNLRSHIEDLYWTGVKQELECLVLMLRKWQQPEFRDISLHENTLIDGFDTFIGQVVPRSQVNAGRPVYDPSFPSQKDYFLYQFQARMVEAAEGVAQSKVKTAVHARLNQRAASKEPELRRRARLLLAAAGFLDIEKLIEHRGHASDNVAAIPQLQLEKRVECGCPVVTPLVCSECKQAICGSRFEREGERSSSVICEDCYWEHHYGDPSFAKKYKSSVVPELVQASHRICNKPHTREYDRFAVGQDYRALHMIAHAKHEYNRKAQRTWNRPLGGSSLAKLSWAEYQEVQRHFASSRRSEERPPGVTEEFRIGKLIQKNPWKNIHMALRVGPLIIENGIAHTMKGPRIGVREATFQRVTDVKRSDRERTYLAVSPGPGRELWSQSRGGPSPPKRFQAVMKQVIGAPFSGDALPEAESDIVALVARLSQSEKGWDVTELQDKVEALLAPWVSVYLDNITERLLDPSTVLTWDATDNSCRQFCDSLLDWQTFGSLTPECTITLRDGSVRPLYQVSFLSRPESLPKAPFTPEDTNQDIPYGLTEEYIRRFWHGSQTGPDIIDWLQEYWYDWCAFKKPPYPHQNLFPWDCTEAVHRYPVKCGECSLSKHLWEFPFDSFSIISLHLLRDRPLYPDYHEAETPERAEHTWMQNRIILLSALDTLLMGATAMTQDPLFQKHTRWLHRADPIDDRAKLGGIYRAQPYSHATDVRSHDAYYVSDWSRLDDKAKQEAYEKAREDRHAPGGIFSSLYFFTGPSRQTPPIVSPSKWPPIPTAWLGASDPAKNSICGTQQCAGGCASNCSADCSNGNCGNTVDCGGGGS